MYVNRCNTSVYFVKIKSVWRFFYLLLILYICKK